jgi:predicted aconitase
MVELSTEEREIAAGARGDGAAMAMRIVAEAARLMGAPRLIPVASAHIDGHSITAIPARSLPKSSSRAAPRSRSAPP